MCYLVHCPFWCSLIQWWYWVWWWWCMQFSVTTLMWFNVSLGMGKQFRKCIYRPLRLLIQRLLVKLSNSLLFLIFFVQVLSKYVYRQIRRRRLVAGEGWRRKQDIFFSIFHLLVPIITSRVDVLRMCFIPIKRKGILVSEWVLTRNQSIQFQSYSTQ